LWEIWAICLSNEDVIAGFVGSPEYFRHSPHFANAPDWPTSAWGNAPDWPTSAYDNILFRPPDDARYKAWLAVLDS
jgi:hypothetical protein